MSRAVLTSVCALALSASSAQAAFRYSAYSVAYFTLDLSGGDSGYLTSVEGGNNGGGNGGGSGGVATTAVSVDVGTQGTLRLTTGTPSVSVTAQGSSVSGSVSIGFWGTPGNGVRAGVLPGNPSPATFSPISPPPDFSGITSIDLSFTSPLPPGVRASVQTYNPNMQPSGGYSLFLPQGQSSASIPTSQLFGLQQGVGGLSVTFFFTLQPQASFGVLDIQAVPSPHAATLLLVSGVLGTRSRRRRLEESGSAR